MSRRFEELAWQATSMGEITLRRRLDPVLGAEVYEVKLGDEYLMSSAFTAGEVALARDGLAAVDGTDLAVVVGGLGLGYTACAVLDDDRVGSLLVVDALAEVIRWHEAGLLPEARALNADPRMRYRHGDFFALAASDDGFDLDSPGHLVDAVLLDVDHTPRHVLHPDHAAFYTVDGLRRLARHLRPGGVFALWSDDPPDADFLTTLGDVFVTFDARVVTFPNPLTGGESTNSVYTAATGCRS